jgi:hypothetical protein
VREEEHDGVGANLVEALWAVGPETKALVTPEMAKMVEDFYKEFGGAFNYDYTVDETRPKPQAKEERPAPRGF